MNKHTVIPLARKKGKWFEVDTKIFNNKEFKEVLEINTFMGGENTETPPSYERKEIGMYATWFSDPTTNIMLHYQTIKDSTVECLVRAFGTDEWETIPLMEVKPFPLTDKEVHWFKITDLEPETVYETKLKNHEHTYKFKTMASTQKETVKFAMTSDQLNDRPKFRRDAKKGFDLIYNQKPEALILAGDIVHDDSTRHGAWTDYWTALFDAVKRNDNWIIPIVAIVGNHDGALWNEDGSFRNNLWESQGGTWDDILFFDKFFSSVKTAGYNVLDIGSYLSLILLNSGHTVPVKGEQTTWLSDTLQERVGRHLFPLYHVNAYPTKYGYDGQYNISKDIRESWGPLFTEYGVKVTGSGHDHMNLVTKKVTGNELDENGVVNVGNGFGLGTLLHESIVPQDSWYIDFIQDETQLHNPTGFDFIEFTTDGAVKINKVSIEGVNMYSKEL